MSLNVNIGYITQISSDKEIVFRYALLSAYLDLLNWNAMDVCDMLRIAKTIAITS